MDGMEVDNGSKCRKNKNKRIKLKISKDCNNQNGLVSQKSGKNHFRIVPESTPKPKPSLKISLPIVHYLKAMQQYKNANADTATSRPNKTEIRGIPEPGLQPTTSLLLNPSSLRMFRHPVPTSKKRAILAGKCAQMFKIPEPISKNTTLKSDPIISHSNITNTPIKESVKKKAEELNTSENKSNTSMLYKSNFDVQLSIRHKLPLTVAPKASYGISSSNPVNKENRLSSSNNIQTTAVQATQTEKVFFVTEEGYQILETIKSSGFTYEDLQNQINNIKKQREDNNDKDCVVIDLVSTEENSESKEILDTVMKHSINNKNVINTAVQIMQLLISQNREPSVTATAPSPERISSISDQQPLLAGSVPPATSEPPPTPGSTVPHTDMVKSFMALATLQQFGFRLTNIALESSQTHIQHRTDSQTSQFGTQTEDESNSSKKRKHHESLHDDSTELANHLEQNNFQRPSLFAVRPSQELMQQQHELPMFQSQMQLRQLRPTQIQQFVLQHAEHPTQMFPSNLPSLMLQQRNQFTMPRNHPQYPFEHNRSSALSTPQIQVQMPSPVQLRHNDPRSKSLRNQLGGPSRLSRVLSTQEANMHSQAAQHPACSWAFPQYRDRHGNVFPQIHQ